MQFKQQQVADEFRWLQMRDLAPEEFLSWLLEWGACAVRARLANACFETERVPEPRTTRSL
ncbi:hypothetical protein EGT09_08390 [Pseudomonas putida]|uniref:hypothetical protein n=1 Tax=Pseudomonas putida TaxID=303 RepID=UPI000F79F8D1|nr:hypothetical protein [Pseudomonas putida]RSC26432.1 hypothetical protein EGT09_08390 [Pseudomonas putida]